MQTKRNKVLNRYKIPENAEKQKEFGRQRYKIPENAEKMKLQSKTKYKSSEIAHSKREHSKTSYNIPERRKRKSVRAYKTITERKLNYLAMAMQHFRNLEKYASNTQFIPVLYVD